MYMTKAERIEALALSWAESQKEVVKLHKKLNKLKKEQDRVAPLSVDYSVWAAKITLAEAMYQAAAEVTQRLWAQYNSAE